MVTYTWTSVVRTTQERVQRPDYGQYHVWSLSLDIPAPLPEGKWSIRCEHADHRPSLVWDGIISELDIVEGTIALTKTNESESETSTSTVLRLKAGTFPPMSSGSAVFDRTLHLSPYQEYTFMIEVVAAEPSNLRNRKSAISFFVFASGLGRPLAEQRLLLLPSRQSFDLVQRIDPPQASPYLTTLLTSGFSESVPQSSLPPAEDTSNSLAAFELLDSDEESDKVVAGPSSVESDNLALASFKRVNITQATYTTYVNVICWIGTGYIAFAPLKSRIRYAGASSPSKAAKPSVPRIATSLPAPASPKSVYRLAVLLELPDLAKLALEHFKSELTPQNAAYELYTDVAETYSEVRDVTLAFVVEHWDQVVESKAFRDIEARAASGIGIDGGTGIMLSKALGARHK